MKSKILLIDLLPEFIEGQILVLSVLICIGWLIYVQYSKKKPQVVIRDNFFYLSSKLPKELISLFTPFVWCSILWALTNAYFNSPLLTAYDENIALVFAQLSNIASFFLAIITYYISCILKVNYKNYFNEKNNIEKEEKVPLSSYIFIIVLSFSNIILNVLPNLVVKGILIEGHEFRLILSDWAWLYYILASIPFFPSLENLSTAMTELRHEYLVSLYILVGALAFYIIALFTNVICPYFYHYYNLTWLPPFSNAVITVSLFGYSFSKRILQEPRDLFKKVGKYVLAVFLLYSIVVFINLLVIF